MEKILEIKNLNVKKEKNILQEINLEINKGDVICVLGQNGQGKSTLLKAIMGYKNIYDIDGKILLNNEDISDLSIDQRALNGLFLSNQDPIEIPGIKLIDFYRNIYEAKNKKVNFINLYKKIENALKEVDLNQDFLNRGINENFSGGEKKKNEIIQMKLLDPEIIMLDEIDSGLDFDTTNLIIKTIKKEIENKKTIIFISHHIETIKELNPNKVILIANNSIVKIDDIKLAIEIFEKGYKETLRKLGIKENKEQVVLNCHKSSGEK